MALATVLGIMPALSTIVPASMVFAVEAHVPPVYRPNSGGNLDVDAATLEHARCRGRQLLVDLWQDPRAGLEEPKADLVPPDARIETQDVVGKGGELTDQFGADESAANHDNRQALAPLRRIHGGVGALEAAD